MVSHVFGCHRGSRWVPSIPPGGVESTGGVVYGGAVAVSPFALPLP